MKNLLHPFTLLFLCAVNAKAQTFPINSYTIHKTSETMLIDGLLNESSWNNVPFTKNFILLNGNAATLITKAKAVWDDTHLYFAFVVEDTSIWATYTKKDDYIFKQDAIEILIDPNGDSLNYAEIGFAPNETAYDLLMAKPYSLGGPANWNWNISGLINQVTVQGNINTANSGVQWICEVSLPFADVPTTPVSLTVPKPGDLWRMNFARVDHNLNATQADQHLYTWTYTDGKDNHVPGRFGKVTFSANDAALGIHETSTPSSLFIQNYPNPFSGSTQFIFNSSTENKGALFIYDSMGKEVEKLSLNIQSGQNSITWNAHEYASGIYFYLLSTANGQQAGKLQIQ